MEAGLTAGTVFAGKYEVVRCVGAGGMGAVYEVVHQTTRRRRALKVLLPNLLTSTDARDRFTQEALVTGEIESEHIVDVFDAAIDEATGAPYLVMELLRGESVGDALTHGRRFTPSEALEILTQTARALERTHAIGLIHRDLKPDNLFIIARDDGRMQIKILDFGIAKMTTATQLTHTGLLGTPLYMAPEQLDGTALDGTTDLYALAHVGFEILTGTHYWWPEVSSAPNPMVFLRQLDRGMPEPASRRARSLGVHVAPAFDHWFHRATATSRSERYQTAAAFLSAFTAASSAAPQALAASSGGPRSDVPHPTPSAPARTAAAPAAALATGTAMTRDPSATPRRTLKTGLLIGLGVGCIVGVPLVLALVHRGSTPVVPAADSATSTVVAADSDTVPSVTATESAPAASVVPVDAAASASAVVSAAANAPSATATAATAANPPSTLRPTHPTQPKSTSKDPACARDVRRCR